MGKYLRKEVIDMAFEPIVPCKEARDTSIVSKLNEVIEVLNDLMEQLDKKGTSRRKNLPKFNERFTGLEE